MWILRAEFVRRPEGQGRQTRLFHGQAEGPGFPYEGGGEPGVHLKQAYALIRSELLLFRKTMFSSSEGEVIGYGQVWRGEGSWEAVCKFLGKRMVR